MAALALRALSWRRSMNHARIGNKIIPPGKEKISKAGTALAMEFKCPAKARRSSVVQGLPLRRFIKIRMKPSTWSASSNNRLFIGRKRREIGAMFPLNCHQKMIKPSILKTTGKQYSCGSSPSLKSVRQKSASLNNHKIGGRFHILARMRTGSFPGDRGDSGF